MTGFFLKVGRYTVDQPTARGPLHIIDTQTRGRVTIAAGEPVADFFDDWEALVEGSVDMADFDRAVGQIFDELVSLDSAEVLA